jgi:2-polyprenyl-3-methyl-5-hydroxy-6-metoxy-1,4-benzoquinol methylase
MTSRLSPGYHEEGAGDVPQHPNRPDPGWHPTLAGDPGSRVDVNDYIPREYWETLHARDDLSAVGQSGLPAEFNAWLYRNGARNLDRFLARSWPRRPVTVYDVGAGTGYWVEYWSRRGARVDGSDLVELAVRRLSERYPGDFRLLDISMERPAAEYDLVSCMNVLLHVIDDEAFERALEHLAGAVAPGGALLLAEPIASQEWSGTTSRARALDRYVEPLAAAGLRLVAIAGTTVIGANPIERSARLDRLWRLWWSGASRIARRSRVASGLLGRVIYALDPTLLRLGLEPSGKFALFERPLSVPAGSGGRERGDVAHTRLG